MSENVHEPSERFAHVEAPNFEAELVAVKRAGSGPIFGDHACEVRNPPERLLHFDEPGYAETSA